MPGHNRIDCRPRYQARNPNSRRQQKFEEKRNRNKISLVPAPNQQLESDIPQQSPVQRSITMYPRAAMTTIVATPQPMVNVVNSTNDKPVDAKSGSGHRKTASIDSGATTGTTKTGHTDKNFYAPKKSSNLNPNAHSWKSTAVQWEDEFARLYKVVSHAAPEQFRNRARPTNSPCNIVPTNVNQLIEHRQAMTEMAAKQMEKNIKSMKDQIAARKAHGAIKSSLGKDGKIHESGHSPVLCMPTIWANEFCHFNYPQAKWPSHAELQFYGDNRGKLASRYGRYLPPPRVPCHYESKFYRTPTLPATFFDQAGPVFEYGPHPAEVVDANLDTDTDPVFEFAALAYIGGDLLDEMDG